MRAALGVGGHQAALGALDGVDAVVAVVAIVGIGALITTARVSRWSELSLARAPVARPDHRQPAWCVPRPARDRRARRARDQLRVHDRDDPHDLRGRPAPPLVLFAKAVTFTRRRVRRRDRRVLRRVPDRPEHPLGQARRRDAVGPGRAAGGRRRRHLPHPGRAARAGPRHAAAAHGGRDRHAVRPRARAPRAHRGAPVAVEHRRRQAAADQRGARVVRGAPLDRPALARPGTARAAGHRGVVLALATVGSCVATPERRDYGVPARRVGAGGRRRRVRWLGVRALRP